MKIDRLVVGPLATNCYVLQENKECIIVDPGGDAEKIKNFVASRGLKPTMVIATHGHFDHILSVNEIKSEFNVPLYLSDKDLDILSKFTVQVKNFFDRDPGSPPVPDGNLYNGMTLQLSGAEISVVETPGHTPGCCTLVAGNVMLTGDFLFAGSIGRTDFGGSMAEMKKSLEWIKGIENDFKIYPGHGDSTTLSVEKKTNPFLLYPDSI